MTLGVCPATHPRGRCVLRFQHEGRHRTVWEHFKRSTNTDGVSVVHWGEHASSFEDES